MRTEILSADEMPAMTAEHMRRLIATAFDAYVTGDRNALESAIGADFTFTSPYDDAIDREGYFQRCWPNHHTIAAQKVERIVIEGDSAYVTYLCTTTSGRSFRNTEFMTFSNGQIASVDVYFGAQYRDGKFIATAAPS